LQKNVKKWNPVSFKKKWWNAVKGICKKSKDRSVVLKTTIDKIKEMNIKASLILEKTKVFNAAFIV
jgi:hypothetical protein